MVKLEKGRFDLSEKIYPEPCISYVTLVNGRANELGLKSR